MWMNDIARTLDPQATHIVNDSKTPSGQVHVGSLRGVLIHDALTRQLQHDGFDVKFTYGIDDYDPMDGLPHDAPQTLQKHMGEPLCHIPAPSGSTATDFADHYIAEFLAIFKELGVTADIYRMRDVYTSGRFNEAIQRILENAQTVREIYKKISHSERPNNWYPFQVICENCGKIGTTEVFDYQNGEVSYRCRPDLVSWAKGCSHEGKISPFNGNGKLPWKLEWAAKWFVFGITAEGAGKDHCTKGGSRDIASQVLRQVFATQPPLNIPYEFFLVKGAKMSSSKGVGASARAMADFLPPEVLRYLLIRSVPKRAVNFSTDLNPIVKNFNEYDALIAAKQANTLTQEQKQLLAGVEVPEEPKDFTPVSFQLLVSMLQLPHIDIPEEVARRAGKALSDSDLAHLNRRIASAQYWLAHYASEEDKYQLQENLPDAWVALSGVQKLFLLRLLDSLEGVEWQEEVLQSHLFTVARCTPIPPKLAFAAIYTIFLDKNSGPKAGTLLSFLDKAFVTKRLSEISLTDWSGCYAELSEDVETLMRFMDEIKPDIKEISLMSELCVNTKAADSAGALGVIRVYYSHKGKAFCRLIRQNLPGSDSVEHQKIELLEGTHRIAQKFAIDFGLQAKLDENVILQLEAKNPSI